MNETTMIGSMVNNLSTIATYAVVVEHEYHRIYIWSLNNGDDIHDSRHRLSSRQKLHTFRVRTRPTLPHPRNTDQVDFFLTEEEKAGHHRRKPWVEAPVSLGSKHDHLGGASAFQFTDARECLLMFAYVYLADAHACFVFH